MLMNFRAILSLLLVRFVFPELFCYLEKRLQEDAEDYYIFNFIQLKNRVLVTSHLTVTATKFLSGAAQCPVLQARILYHGLFSADIDTMTWLRKIYKNNNGAIWGRR